MKFSLFVQVALMLCTLTLAAQPTINHQDILQLKDYTLTYQGYLVYGSNWSEPFQPGIPGPNRIWDFSHYHEKFSHDGNLDSLWIQEEYIDPDNTPYFEFHPTSNLVLKETIIDPTGKEMKSTFFDYFQVSKKFMVYLGSGFTDSEQVIPFYKQDIVAEFPLIYGKEWKYVDTFTYSLGGIGGWWGKTRNSYFNVTHSTQLIDGWGHIILPTGKNIPCLRLQKQDSIFLYQNSYSSAPDTSIRLTYSWLSTNLYKIAELRSKTHKPKNLNLSSFKTDYYGYLLLENVTHISVPQINQDRRLVVYPNPSHSNIQLKYTLNQPSPVYLGVYNHRGQLVSTLVDRFQTAGTYTISWPYGIKSSGLSPGVYGIKLQYLSQIIWKKLILME